jgi:hypothetical protein
MGDPAMKCPAAVIASILFFAACDKVTQPDLLAPEVSTTLDVASATPVSTFTVTNTTDAGSGSLRQAIIDANGSPGTDLIDFNISGNGPHTIQPASSLPTITDPVVIDGYTQPGASPNTNGPGLGSNAVLKIELDGTNAGAGQSVNALHITGGGSTIRGLVINRSGGFSIRIDDNGGNLVQGNFIGTDVTGTVALSGGLNGVRVLNSGNNTIGGTTPVARNVISGNGHGVVVIGSSATGNLIQGNFIGTDITGTVDLGNQLEGVAIGGPNNTIGGTTPAARNVISGNDRRGIQLGLGSSGNLVQGNFIGTDVTGTADLGNSQHGVDVDRSPDNTIGGTVPEARNIISGNEAFGVAIRSGSTENLVQGNFIGTDVTGTVDLGNTLVGVGTSASNTTIGGTAAAARNVISGNGAAGVQLSGVGRGVTGTVVQGNFIGTDVTGTVDLGNTRFGVSIFDNANTMIGGATPGAGNVISGNDNSGIHIGGAQETVVQGNFIGTDVTGTIALGNSGPGVHITRFIPPGSGNVFNASDNTIGGTTAGASNVISANNSAGVLISSSGQTGNLVQANSIFSNGGLGIDLSPNTGVTPNDAGDGDTQ